MRLYSIYERKQLCSVLPMPCVSPLEKILCVCYSRELNLVYCLLNTTRLWIYTTRSQSTSLALFTCGLVIHIYLTNIICIFNYCLNSGPAWYCSCLFLASNIFRKSIQNYNINCHALMNSAKSAPHAVSIVF